MAFKPGESGNLSGRPKGHASLMRRIREQFAEGPTHNLLNEMIAIARNTSGDVEPRDRIKAIEWMAAYGFGKPKESLDDGTVQRLAQAMFDQAMSEARSRALAARSVVPAQLVEPEPATSSLPGNDQADLPSDCLVRVSVPSTGLQPLPGHPAESTEPESDD
jgi:hypothetical protein